MERLLNPQVILSTALTVAMLYPLRPAQAQTADVLALCGEMGETADSIVDARNAGTPMSTLLAAMSEVVSDSPTDQESYEVLSTIVRLAYAEPRYQTPEMQASQKAAFREEIELWCFDTFEE